MGLSVTWSLLVPQLQTTEDTLLTVNAKFGASTFGLFLLLNLNWVRKAKMVSKKAKTQRKGVHIDPFRLKDKVNWYQVLFATPLFMRDAGERIKI